MFDNVTNKDDERRQEIIEECGGEINKRYIQNGKYDILSYTGLTAEGLDKLLAEGFADNDERQNSCPCVWEINKFLHEHPNFTAHGYIVTPDRDDYRVSIDGVEGEDCYEEDTKDFIEMFRRADEFTINGGYCYCWYD